MKGYTFIEVLIVLLILSITASMALLAVSRNEDRSLQRFTDELMQLVILAQEQALLRPAVLGMSFSDDDVQFTQYQDTGHQPGQWVPLHDRVLHRYVIPEGIAVNLEAKESLLASDQHHPQMIISTNGEVTPFTMLVGKKGQKPQYAIVAQANGQVIRQTRS
jgi:type II secretion system protein H